MVAPLTYAVSIYVAGVVWGLFVIDERPVPRVGLALLWPLGPIAFVITITALVAAATIAFPVFGVVLITALLVVWWTLF